MALRGHGRRVPREKVVVLRALGLGDVLTALPALRAIARSHRGAELLLLAPAPFAPLLALAGTPYRLLDVRDLDGPLPEEARSADRAYDLHGRGPQSHRLLLGSEPAELVAFANDEVHESPPTTFTTPLAWDPELHEVHRWCALVQAVGVACDPDDLFITTAPGHPVERTGPADRQAGATVLHPGASSAARRWPVERWAEVARAEVAAGRRVLLTGSVDERAICETVRADAELPEGSDLSGRTTITELAGAVAAAGCVVCGDTGVAHLATALGTPSVLLFGPSSPRLWGPPPQLSCHTVLWAGCSGDPHADEPHVGLLQISVGEVVDAITSTHTQTRTRRPWVLAPR